MLVLIYRLKQIRGREMHSLGLLQVGAKYLDFLADHGLQVSVTTDFETIPDLAKETGRNYQLPTFDIARVDHTEKSAFWIFLHSGDERIASAAALLQDLGSEDARSYLKRVARHQYPHPKGDPISEVAEPLGEMAGRLAYIGELCIEKSYRGFPRVAGAFIRLLQLTAVAEWDVDWTYAFIPDRHMRAQLSKFYGFSRQVAFAQGWLEPTPNYRSPNEWWCASSRRELNWLFKKEIESDTLV